MSINQGPQTQVSVTTVAKQMTQGEAVVQAVRDVLKSDYKEGVKVTLSDDQRKAVTEMLVKGFIERRIPLKASPANEGKIKDTKQLHTYVKGLINNWLTKSPLLNGKPKKAKPSAAPNATATTVAVASDAKAPFAGESKPAANASEQAKNTVEQASAKTPVSSGIKK